MEGEEDRRQIYDESQRKLPKVVAVDKYALVLDQKSVAIIWN